MQINFINVFLSSKFISLKLKLYLINSKKFNDEKWTWWWYAQDGKETMLTLVVFYKLFLKIDKIKAKFSLLIELKKTIRWFVSLWNSIRDQ